MPDEQQPPPTRRPRADAERNRARLVQVAKAVFAEKGAAASLDEIARIAGVGAGTLYRHFPTRDALVTAVYRNETTALAAAADRLAEQQPALVALREWLLLFVDYIATKTVLKSMVGASTDLSAASTAQLRHTIARLVDRAAARGDVRNDLDPVDLLRAIAGVVNSGPEGRAAARNWVDVMIKGMQSTSF